MREGSAVAQINSSGKSVPHACVICAPTIELALSEAEKLAAAAVCSGVGARPCGKCSDCRKAAEHVDPDIITVSRLLDDKGRPKREIGVDQIRDVIADAQVLPNEAARKVYIIDRAETMNAAAQNAALKLLEEPPAGAVFLLCTTNAMQLLPTVRSRCAEVICQGQEQETDSELRSLAADYLKAVAEGNRAKLLRWCAANEGMDGRAAVDFIDCVRALVADMLCSRQKARGMERAELMELHELLDECAARLKVNAGVKHIFGLLAVDSIPAGRKQRKNN